MHYLNVVMKKTGVNSFDVSETCESLGINSESTLSKCTDLSLASVRSGVIFHGINGNVIAAREGGQVLEQGPDVYRYIIPIKVIANS